MNRKTFSLIFFLYFSIIDSCSSLYLLVWGGWGGSCSVGLITAPWDGSASVHWSSAEVPDLKWKPDAVQHKRKKNITSLLNKGSYIHTGKKLDQTGWLMEWHTDRSKLVLQMFQHKRWFVWRVQVEPKDPNDLLQQRRQMRTNTHFPHR